MIQDRVSHTQKLIFICLLMVAIVIVGSVYLPAGIDWRDTYRPAALALMSGQSPYTISIFFIAPWGLIPLLPFALLPVNIGRACLFLIGLSAYAYTAYKLGARPVSLVAFLISPPVVHGLLNSNIEWLPLLGFVLPPQIGLLFVAIKPQIGIGVAIFWLIEAWRKGGVREVIRITWPVSLALLISFALFGLWPLRFRETLILTQAYNASLWPSSLPVGLTLFVAAIHRRNINYAMASSPCLSPYVLLHAWVGALAAVVSQPVETIAAVVGLWILVGFRALTGAS
jgi:hypothetical protein